jgi:hypothetical protein
MLDASSESFMVRCTSSNQIWTAILLQLLLPPARLELYSLQNWHFVRYNHTGQHAVVLYAAVTCS